MPINRPDSFASIGTAIVDGGETQQITEIISGPNIELEQYQVPILTERGFSRPAVAFSLRKLRTVNKCIQVQAGSNPAQDIGFARNERGVMAIDEQQLLDYARQYPTSEIRVNKIYDQSGNGNDLVNDGGGARFKAVTDAVTGGLPQRLFKDSAGNPYLEATGSDDYYNLEDSGISVSENFCALLVSAGDFNSGSRFFGGPNTNDMGFTFSGTDSMLFNNGPLVSSASFTAGGTRLNENIFFFNSENNGDAVRAYQNNIASPDNPIDQTSYSYPRTITQGTGTTGSATNGNIILPTSGNWQEMIFWNNESNEHLRQQIYDDANYYYRTQANPPTASVIIKQPNITRKTCTVLSKDLNGIVAVAGAVGEHHIHFENWSTPTGNHGKIVFWNASSGDWELADSSSSNATLLLGMRIAQDGRVCKRGFIRTTRNFSSFSLGQPLFLGTNGEVITVKPTSANNIVRAVGWVCDQNATAGLMFFSPDVNHEIVA